MRQHWKWPENDRFKKALNWKDKTKLKNQNHAPKTRAIAQDGGVPTAYREIPKLPISKQFVKHFLINEQ